MDYKFQKSLICILICLVVGLNVNASNKEKTKDKTQKTYERVDTMPQFPGGNTELMKYIHSSMQYPEKAKKDGVEGLVITKFTVDEKGKISDIYVAYSVSPLLEQEALRLVKKMPKWTPGKQDGQLVPVKVTMPIMFKL